MRGRKSIGEDAKPEIFSIRLTRREKEVLDKNDWLKKDLITNLRVDLKNLWMRKNKFKD